MPDTDRVLRACSDPWPDRRHDDEAHELLVELCALIDRIDPVPAAVMRDARAACCRRVEPVI